MREWEFSILWRLASSEVANLVGALLRFLAAALFCGNVAAAGTVAMCSAAVLQLLEAVEAREVAARSTMPVAAIKPEPNALEPIEQVVVFKAPAPEAVGVPIG